MSDYTPDRWKLIKITNSKQEVHYRIFATWGGSYLYGSSWKVSSGCISGATAVGGSDDWDIPQSSGSIYSVRSGSEGVCGGWNCMLTLYADQLEAVGGKLEIIDNPDFSALKSEFV